MIIKKCRYFEQQIQQLRQQDIHTHSIVSAADRNLKAIQREDYWHKNQHAQPPSKGPRQARLIPLSNGYFILGFVIDDCFLALFLSKPRSTLEMWLAAHEGLHLIYYPNNNAPAIYRKPLNPPQTSSLNLPSIDQVIIQEQRTHPQSSPSLLPRPSIAKKHDPNQRHIPVFNEKIRSELSALCAPKMPGQVSITPKPIPEHWSDKEASSAKGCVELRDTAIPNLELASKQLINAPQEQIINAPQVNRFATQCSGTFFPNDFSSRLYKHLKKWGQEQSFRNRTLDRADAETWPHWLLSRLNKSLGEDSDAHWFTLFALGECQGLGRTSNAHHLAFLQMLDRHGWWQTFVDSADPHHWMEVLRAWQDSADTNFRHWMRLFPAFYQLRRYLGEYRQLIREIEHSDSPHRAMHFFSPRSHPRVRGAGRRFNIPDYPSDIGRHWVLRELFRRGILHGEHLHPLCWFPSQRICNVINHITIHAAFNDILKNHVKSMAIHSTVKHFIAQSDLDLPLHLHFAFDLALDPLAKKTPST